MFSEFDKALPPSEREAGLMQLGIPVDEELPAALSDPACLEAVVVDPKSRVVGYPSARWSQIPLPLRIKAFYCWIDLSDFVAVAAHLGVRVSTIRHLHKSDQWEVRARELSDQFQTGLRVKLEKSRSSLLGWFSEYLACLEPAKLAAMSDPLGAAGLIRAIGGALAQAPVHVHAQNAQVNAGAGPSQMNASAGGGPFADLDDAQLLALARESGVSVQPAPRVGGSNKAPVTDGSAGPSPGSGTNPGDGPAPAPPGPAS